MQKLSPESSNLEICNYYSYNYSGFSMKPHSHAAVEIMYQNGGACDVLIFGAQKIKIALKKGQAVVIGNGVPHSLYVPPDTRCKILNLEIGSSCCGGLDFNKIFSENKSLRDAFFDFEYFVIDDNADIYSIISSIQHELVTKNLSRASDKLLIDSRLLTLLSVVSESLIRSKISGNAKIISAINFILQEYASDLTVSRAARHVGLNPIYFQKQFKLNTGKTVLEYITNLRIERAKILLENTDLSVIDIAAESGFNSRQALYQNFKKLYSVSPDGYRKKIAALYQTKYRQASYEKPTY